MPLTEKQKVNIQNLSFVDSIELFYACIERLQKMNPQIKEILDKYAKKAAEEIEALFPHKCNQYIHKEVCYHFKHNGEKACIGCEYKD